MPYHCEHIILHVVRCKTGFESVAVWFYSMSIFSCKFEVLLKYFLFVCLMFSIIILVISALCVYVCVCVCVCVAACLEEVICVLQ